ncbi:MAG: DNA repair protein RecO [Verrucomicrobiota bacterium]
MDDVKDRAILLRKTRYSDTSLIVAWFTREHGLVKTMAKGALRPKSPFKGTLDLFFGAEIVYAHSRKSELHHLKEVHVNNPRLDLRKSYEATLVAAYFVKLVDSAVEAEAPVEGVFDLLGRALDHLADTPPAKSTILHFEKRLAGELGILSPDRSALQALEDQGHRLPPERGKLLTRFGD